MSNFEPIKTTKGFKPKLPKYNKIDLRNMCKTTKVSYSSRKDAKAAAKRCIEQGQSTFLKTYRCGGCGFFHLTSSKRHKYAKGKKRQDFKK